MKTKIEEVAVGEQFKLEEETLYVAGDGPTLDGFVFAKRVNPSAQRAVPGYWRCIEHGTMVETLPGWRDIGGPKHGQRRTRARPGASARHHRRG